MNLNFEEQKQAIRRVHDRPVIWRGLRCTCVAVIGDTATIIWKPGEMFERVPLAEIRDAQPGDEYIDHCDRIIVCKAAPTIDPAWTSEGLRRGSWSAYLQGSRDDSDGFPVDPPNPNCWRAYAGAYMVSDQDVVVRNGGSSKTYVIYLDPEEYVKRLAQRALELWIPEIEEKIAREKDGKIRMLMENNAILKDEIERLWLRLGSAIGKK